MSTPPPRRVSLVLVIVCLMVVAPVAGAGGPAGSADSVSSDGLDGSASLVSSSDMLASNDDLIDVTDNLSIWERAVLPFRANTTEAATIVDNQDLWVVGPDGETVRANRDVLAVFDTGEVPLTYETVSGATTSEFAGEDVQIVVGKLTEDVTEDDANFFIDLLELSVDEARDNVSLEMVNENVTFDSVETDTLDPNGELEDPVTFDADDPGQYVAFIATVDEEDGFAVDDGDLEHDGASTIIGVEHFAVHVETTAEVSHPDEVERGDDVTFDVETGLDDEEQISHVVVLYHEETFTDARTNINVTAEADSNLSRDDVIIEHEIVEFDGAAVLEDDVEIAGVSIDSGESVGAISVADVVSFLANESDFDEPERREIGDTILNASITGIGNASAEEQIELQTTDTWVEGEFRWVHIASEADRTDRFTTATGTLEIVDEIEEPDPPPPPPPPPAPPPAPPDPPPPPPPEDIYVPADPVAENVKEVVDQALERNARISIHFGETSESQRSGVQYRYVNFTATENITVDVEFNQSAAAPDGVGPVPTDEAGMSHLELDYPEAVGGAADDVALEILVRNEAIDERGVDAEHIVFYRHDGEEWSQVDRELIAVNETHAIYRIESPGLSVYAPTVEDVEFQMVDSALSETEILAGDVVDVSATIENVGDRTAEFTATMTVGGIVVDEQVVEIPAGETRTLETTIQLDNIGTFEVALNEDAIGTVTVEEEEDVVIDAHTLTVTVIDDEAQVLEDARVIIDDEEAITGPDGLAVFDLVDGEYTVQVEREGFEEDTIDVTVEGADESVTVTLVPDDPDPFFTLPRIIALLILLQIVLGAGYYFLRVRPRQPGESGFPSFR